MAELNDKQKRFCEEYSIDGNATQAAIRAGYSPKTAGSIGFNLLKKAEINEMLDELNAAAAERCNVTKDEAIGMWREIWVSASAKRAKGEGESATLAMVDYAAACKAADALAKVAGVYEKDNGQRSPSVNVFAWAGEDDGEA